MVPSSRSRALPGAIRLAPFALVLLFSARGAAQPAPARSAESDRAGADTLFREARTLLGQGKLQEACDDFAKSQRLDPSPGTLLNLGACHEKQGDLLRARGDFEQAAALALQHSDSARRRAWTEAAERELAGLRPRIPLLRWKPAVPGASSLWLDDAPLPGPLPATGTPVNPGTHRVEARAAGHLAWQQELRVAEGDAVDVVVPALAPEPSRALETGPTSTPPARTAEAPPAETRSLLPAWVAFGASGALVAGGIVTGLVARSAESTLERQCKTPDPAHTGGVICDPSLEPTRDRARRFAVLTDVLWGGALVGAGLGVYFVVKAGDHGKGSGAATRASASTVRARVGSECATAGCSLRVAGTF